MIRIDGVMKLIKSIDVEYFINGFDLLVKLYDICDNSIPYFSKALTHFKIIMDLDSNLKTTYRINDENLTEIKQETAVFCDNYYENSPKENKKLLNELCENYVLYLDMVIVLLINQIDTILGENEKRNMLRNLRFSDDTRIIKPLNEKTLGQVKLILSSTCLDSSRPRIGREPKEIGTSTEILLKNLIYLPPVKGKYNNEISICSYEEIRGLADVFKDGGSLKMAYSGVSPKEFFITETEGSDFFIKGFHNEKEIMDKLNETIRHMDMIGVDIVILPEICMTFEIQKYIVTKLLPETYNIKIAVLGSIWENNTNCSYIYSGSGRLITRQFKLNKFHVTNDFTKDGNHEGINLELGDHTIKLVDIYGFGRVSNTICVDNFVDGIKDLCRTIGIDYYFSPYMVENLSKMRISCNEKSQANCSWTIAANACTFTTGRRHRNTGLAYIPKLKNENRDDGFFEYRNCFNMADIKECRNKICYDYIQFENNGCSHVQIRL